MRKYNIFDFILLQAFIVQEIKYLPSPYSEELRSKWNEQLFCTFNDICHAKILQNDCLNLEEFHDFLGCFEHTIKNSADEKEVNFYILYNLCAAYNLFVTKTPVHPAGTPFPGGFRVERINAEYYCPVKDKQKDVFEALCRFCTAKQAEL